MNYDEIRNSIQTADVISMTGKRPFSKAVQLVTKNKKSHVGLAAWLSFNGGRRRLCVFEALEGKGVGFRPLSHILKLNIPVYWHQIIDPTIDRYGMMNFCLERWGESYADWYQFLIYLSPTIKYLRTLLGKSLDSHPARWHCAELVTTALVNQGFQWFKDPVLTTPGDVAKFSCLRDGILLEG